MSNTPTEELAAEALKEVIDLYRQTDADDENVDKPLSGADFIDEVGIWMERNQKLMRVLGILEDPAASES